MLRNILIGLASILVLIAAIAGTRPSAYRIERQLAIAAPTERVFGVINDLRQFAGVFVLFGTPLEKRDPNMQKVIEGPAAGVGQSYAWTGPKAGQGKLTIEESVPGQKLRLKLEFEKPMKSLATCQLTLAGTPTGSTVTWSMEGNHNFLGKLFGLFLNMDNLLGADLEKSLVQLKTVAEGKAR